MKLRPSVSGIEVMVTEVENGAWSMASDEFQRFDVQFTNPVTIVKLKDAKILDHLIVVQLAEELRTLVEELEKSQLLLDMTQVKFLSSAALNNLVILNRHIAARKGRIVLAELQEPVREVFTYTGLNRLFTLADTVEEGLKAFAS